jgi:cation diffusion facilitator CzcD-associated flavoprotein CzcO
MARHGTREETAQLRREIRRLKREGHSNRLIARVLGVCEATVRYHLCATPLAHQVRDSSRAPVRDSSRAPGAREAVTHRRYPPADELPNNVLRLRGHLESAG